MVFGPLVHQDKVKSVIATLSVDGPKANLEKFTSFRTRCKHFSVNLLSPHSNIGTPDYRSDVSPLNGPFSVWLIVYVVDWKGKPALAKVQDRRGTVPSASSDTLEPNFLLDHRQLGL